MPHEQHDHPARRRLRVLHALAAPDGTTRFVDQVIGGAPPEVEIRTFTWRTALLSRYDLLHVHWPEFLARRSLPLTLMLLARLRLTGTPIVRTLHNPSPHESGSMAERLVLRLVDRRTSFFIRLNETTETPSGAASALILHGHYRERFRDLPHAATVPGRILYFGLVRPYKGVDALLSAFRTLPDESLTLRIVGQASEDRAIPVREAEAADDRISSRLEFVPDADLVAEVSRAELVVLPYRELHNSGSLLVAVSLDRPALVPATDSTRAFQDEVGADWVLLYEGELTAARLAEALGFVRERRASASAPSLEGRDWGLLGEQSYQAYLSALTAARMRRRRQAASASGKA